MNPILDPLSRIDLPPSRHAMESDSEESEDEDDQQLGSLDEQMADSLETLLTFEPLDGTGQQWQGKELVVLSGQAGEALAKELNLQEQGQIMWKQRQQGSLAAGEDEKVAYMLLYPSSVLVGDLRELSRFTRELLRQLQLRSLYLLSQYTPSLYLSSKREGSTSTTIRYLSSLSFSSPSSSCEPYAAPNYLVSTDAAIMQEAAYQGIESLALLLPNTAPQSIPPPAPPRKRSSQSSKRRRGNPLTDGGSAMAQLHEEFLSDEDEEMPEEIEAVDPPALDIEDPQGTATQVHELLKSGKSAGLPSSSSAVRGGGVGLADFVEKRRKEAMKRRRGLGGLMYL